MENWMRRRIEVFKNEKERNIEKCIMRSKKEGKMEKEEKEGLFVFGCVVIAFIGMKILEVL